MLRDFKRKRPLLSTSRAQPYKRKEKKGKLSIERHLTDIALAADAAPATAADAPPEAGIEGSADAEAGSDYPIASLLAVSYFCSLGGLLA